MWWGLTTAYGIEKLLSTGYRIGKILSPDHSFPFYSLQTKIGLNFTVYMFQKCPITVYGKSITPPLILISLITNAFAESDPGHIIFAESDPGHIIKVNA